MTPKQADKELWDDEPAVRYSYGLLLDKLGDRFNELLPVSRDWMITKRPDGYVSVIHIPQALAAHRLYTALTR